MTQTVLLTESVEEVRRLTCLALPEDDTYIYRLGVALYGFASINSFMCEVIAQIDSQYNHTKLQDMESGEILDIFRHTLKALKSANRFPSICDVMKIVADLFEDLNTQRNDIIHTYPITNKKGEQILHRRKDGKGKYFEVTNDFLGDFISRLHDVSNGLYQMRDEIEGKK